MNRTVFSIIFLLILVLSSLGADSYLEEGEKLYAENKPVEAKPFFEEALTVDPMNERIYFYLATVYEQLGQPQEAYDTLKKGLPFASTLKPDFYFNMGNNLISMDQNLMAIEMYSKAILNSPKFPKSYLNRGTARAKQKLYKEAIIDYEKYLELEPSSPNRTTVEELIRRFKGAIEAEEKAAQAKQLKDENLKKLLESLQNASDNTETISAGAGETEENNEEDGLLD